MHSSQFIGLIASIFTIAAALPSGSHHHAHKVEARAVTPSSSPSAGTVSIPSGATASKGAPATGAISFASGVNYSPFTSTGACKSAAQIQADTAALSNYDLIRLYRLECGVEVMFKSLRAGQTIMMGIWDVTQATTEGQAILTAAAGNYGIFKAIMVGNEALFNGVSLATLQSAIAAVQAQFKSTGIPVSTAEANPNVLSNPGLCNGLPFIGVNIHPWFNANTVAANAGPFVNSVSSLITKECNIPIVVTESGWPWQATQNGVAVASPANQAVALASLRSNVPNLVLFQSEDALYKSDPNERYWGIKSSA